MDMDFATQLKGLHYLGIRTVLRTVRYAVYRDVLDRKYESKRSRKRVKIGRLLDATPVAGGLDARFETATLEIRFLAPDLARVTWQPGVLPVPYAIARADWPAVDVAWTPAADGGGRLSTSALEVTLGTDGGIAFAEPGKAPLRQDTPPERIGDGWASVATLDPTERIHGLGFRTHAMDLRGGEFGFWNTEPKGAYGPASDPLYVNVPVWLSLRDHGSALVFFENSFRAKAAFRDAQEILFDGGALRYYVIPGPLARAYDRFSELTGRPALPPMWALGFHQCRWSYRNEAEVREVADGFAANDLPLSSIHMDIHYMDGHRVFTVDKTAFPDLKALSADLLQRGIRLVTILDPGVKKDDTFDVYTAGKDAGMYCTLPDGSVSHADVWPGTCGFPDFTDPKARAWWGDLYPRLLDQGITGFWHDMNEPAAFAAWGTCTLPLATRHDMEGRGGDHLEGHNLYGLLENRAGYEALARHRPDARPWILSRSGWVGLPRYAWHWTGDSESNWWSLRQTLRIVLSLGLSGIPYTGSDIGGFGGIMPQTELMIRWFQAQAFLPFFRIHSAFFTQRREPWCFGEEPLGILREALRLRYALMPYWYTLALQAHRTGAPLVRPLFWDDPTDGGLQTVDDAFLLGDALLAAPVIEEGATARRVRLPAGRWYAIDDQESFTGGRDVIVNAPLNRIPVFARAGSVVPMDDAGRTVLHLWAPAEGAAPGGALYRDAGDGHGASRYEGYAVATVDGAIELTRTAEGAYPEPAEGLVLRLRGATAAKAAVDGVEITGPGPWTLPNGWVKVRILPD
jgi:alpha-glucosidase